MMVAVVLKQFSQQSADLWTDGERYWYYDAVDNFGRRAIAEANWGFDWFYAWEWDQIKAQLAENGVKLTKRWYHVNRLRKLEAAREAVRL